MTSVSSVLSVFAGALACMIMTVLCLEFSDSFFTATSGIEATLATILPLVFGFGTVLFLILGIIASVRLSRG